MILFLTVYFSLMISLVVGCGSPTPVKTRNDVTAKSDWDKSKMSDQPSRPEADSSMITPSPSSEAALGSHISKSGDDRPPDQPEINEDLPADSKKEAPIVEDVGVEITETDVSPEIELPAPSVQPSYCEPASTDSALYEVRTFSSEIFSDAIEGPSMSPACEMFMVGHPEKPSSIARVRWNNNTSEAQISATLESDLIGRVNGTRFFGASTVFAADYINHTILKISLSEVVPTLEIFANCTGIASQPNDLTLVMDGTIYASDPNNGNLVKISPQGKCTSAMTA